MCNQSVRRAAPAPAASAGRFDKVEALTPATPPAKPEPEPRGSPREPAATSAPLAPLKGLVATPAARAVAPEPEHDFDAAVQREEHLDQLVARGAAGERLAQHCRDEAELLARLEQLEARAGKAALTELPFEVRELCLGALNACVCVQKLPTELCFRAALFLDAYCAASGKSLEDLVPLLPAACVAAGQLAGKLERTSSPVHAGTSMVQVAAQVVLRLRQLGHDVEPEASAEALQAQILQQEYAILEALQWRLTCPTVKSWLEIVGDRLDVLTCGSYSKVLAWANTSGETTARTLVLHNSTFGRLSPRQMANGLLCVYLVKSGMVPLQALKPAHLDAYDWEALFCQSMQQAAPPTCTLLHPNAVLPFLCLLQTASGSRPEELQQDTLAALTLMLDLVRSKQEEGAASPCHSEASVHHI